MAAGVRLLDDCQRTIERCRLLVEIAGIEPHPDSARIALDREQGRTGHRRGQRLRAAHAAQAAGENPFSVEIASVMLPSRFSEGFVGTLDDALAADVDPRAGGHLPVHHQALRIELMEVLPRRPVRHQVRIGDQHARRIGMRLEHADRLARLHEQRFVVVELLQHFNDLVEALPVAGCAGNARHTRSARRAFLQPRDRGCSSASAVPPPSAMTWHSAESRAGRVCADLRRRACCWREVGERSFIAN